MKNAFGIFAVLAIVGFAAPASAMTEKQASKQIAQAVSGIKFLAASGVTIKKVEAGLSVKESMLALAIKEGISENEKDFTWAGKSSEAWNGDSGNFGETNMKEAYAYIMNPVDGDETPVDKKELASAKEAFKLFLGTGVKFGVAPLGAVQCGGTFAALAIIDPYTGKIYLFAKEGSGC